MSLPLLDFRCRIVTLIVTLSASLSVTLIVVILLVTFNASLSVKLIVILSVTLLLISIVSL